MGGSFFLILHGVGMGAGSGPDAAEFAGPEYMGALDLHHYKATNDLHHYAINLDLHHYMIDDEDNP